LQQINYFHSAMPNPAPQHLHDHDSAHTHGAGARPALRLSVLAWPAWLRVLAVLPLVLALWLAVAWANAGIALW
jgi:hypothetical protein